MSKVKRTVGWVIHRPTVLVNIAGLLLILLFAVSYTVYELTRPLDVLSHWEIKTSSAKTVKDIDGKKVSVYNPGSSLVFESESIKILDAKGTITRTIVCEATESQIEREIQLDTTPATRPAGESPKRENAITIPDVIQFAELPRWCRLMININYENVALYRSHSERAISDRFIVEEEKLVPSAIRKQIDMLNERISELESELSSQKENTVVPSSTTINSNQSSQEPVIAAPNSSQPNPEVTNNTTTNTTNNLPSETKYQTVCDPLINLLGIRIGEINCREEAI